MSATQCKLTRLIDNAEKDEERSQIFHPITTDRRQQHSSDLVHRTQIIFDSFQTEDQKHNDRYIYIQKIFWYASEICICLYRQFQSCSKTERRCIRCAEQFLKILFVSTHF